MRAWVAVALAMAGCRSSAPDSFPEARPLRLTQERVLVTKSDGTVAVFDEQSGERVWQRALREPSPGPISYPPLHVVCEPSMVGASVVLRTEEELLVLSISDGQLERRTPAEPVDYFASAACPVSLGDATFVLAVDGGTRVVRRTLAGHDLWRYSLPAEERADRALSVLDAGETLVVRTDRRLLGLDREGRARWHRRLVEYE